MSMGEYHKPVLLDEAIYYLHVAPGKRFVDATVGGGGHAASILRKGGYVLGIDTDREAITESSSRLGREFSKDSWTLAHGNFRDIGEIARAYGFESVDGILFDLGVSSHQLDTDTRGFSYRFEAAPLDLRLNQDSPVRASDIVRTYSEEDLYEVFATFGEEERSGSISRALVRARTVKPLETIRDVTNVLEKIVPKAEMTKTLARVLQALRIAVNDELGSLKRGLEQASTVLASGGYLVVITFHSLEDRIVKQFMKRSGFDVITKKPVSPSEEEIQQNSRARSAKLRAARKL